MLEELRIGCIALFAVGVLLLTALVALLIVGGTSWLVLTNPTAHAQTVRVVLSDGRQVFLGEVGAGETITQVVPLAGDQGDLVATTQAGRFVCNEYLTHPERWELVLDEVPRLHVSGQTVRCSP